jgi:phospho-N-acetylmuramoyl-pentapeptide-transferase
MESNFFIGLILSFILTVILCPIMIPFFKKMKFGQNIREEGPQAHLSKKGTPTMGGIVLILAIIPVSFLFVKDSPEIIPVIFLTVAFGIIGFLDDYIKVVKKRSLGLRAWQKLLLQFLFTLVFIIYVVNFMEIGSEVILPFSGGMQLDLKYLYIPMLFIFILGTVNGVNFTDGLDGLASAGTLVVAVFFGLVSIKIG